MDYLSAVLALLAVWVVVVMTPGPNFLVTVHHALRHSRRAGVLAALGVALGTLVWASSAWLGLSLIVARLGWVYDAIRIVGALYLIALGLKALFGSGGAASQPVAGRTPVTAWRAFRNGLVVDLSNPKAATFFTSLFIVMLPADAPAWVGAATVASVVCIAAAWYSSVALLFGFDPVARTYARMRRWMDRFVGALFVFFGGRLLLER